LSVTPQLKKRLLYALYFSLCLVVVYWSATSEDSVSFSISSDGEGGHRQAITHGGV